MYKKFFTLALLLSMITGVFAQTASITGKVVDADTDRALPSVTVKVGTQQTLTDETGKYLISGLTPGEIVVEFSVTGFSNHVRQFTIAEGENVLDVIAMDPDFNTEIQMSGLSEISISSDGDDDSKGQYISGLLSSSNDVFVSVASYTFGGAYFRMRGYDNDLNSTYLGGSPISDVETGRTTWALWGGLNDATRTKVSVSGLAPADFTFGNLGSATNIITRASQHRIQTKLTYSSSNRSYTNRLMLTHSTGMMDNNWAVTLSASRRWGNGGYVEGTYYDAYAWFLGIERKLNGNHSIGLTVFDAPVRRGQQGGSTQEAYDLTGTNYYNPNWGYQDGKVRNARERIMNQPVVMFNHYWDISSTTKINTVVSYLFGETGTTALNWYNAADPRPDYYRYLPSYFPSSGTNPNGQYYDPEVAAALTDKWKNDVNTRQVNWDRLYQINYLANLDGKQGRYMIEHRHNDQNQLNLSSYINHEVNDRVKINGGIELTSNIGNYYKTVEDLLGADYWVDIDQFAERDFPGNDTTIQNDLNDPNRVLGVGDKFGYEYDLHQQNANIWAVANFSTLKLDYYFGGQFSYTSFWREGFMRNGRYPDNSYGEGEKHNFADYGLKAGATYKITGRHFVEANAVLMSRAPSMRNSYLSARVRDAVVPDIQSEQIAGGELSYHLRTPAVKGRITLYHTLFKHQSEVNSYYHDSLRTFVNQSIYNISKVHQGLEVGAEIKLTSVFSVIAAANVGNYRYTNRPSAVITVENRSRPDIEGTIYNKYFYVSGTPQLAASAGLKYAGPGFLFMDVNVNYFDNIYLDFNPERRTPRAISNLGPGDPLIGEITRQEKLPSAVTVDASIGKSFRLMRKYYLNLNLSVSNILDNQQLITGGYEQNRFDFADKNIDKFPPKYYYYYGRTYFLNIGFRF